jgi:hypothetical protein
VHSGLYSRWDECPTKVGDMPLTKLGHKVFPKGKQWGTQLMEGGELDRFVDQLHKKPDDVFVEFVEKFMTESGKRGDQSAGASSGAAPSSSSSARDFNVQRNVLSRGMELDPSAPDEADLESAASERIFQRASALDKERVFGVDENFQEKLQQRYRAGNKDNAADLDLEKTFYATLLKRNMYQSSLEQRNLDRATPLERQALESGWFDGKTTESLKKLDDESAQWKHTSAVKLVNPGSKVVEHGVTLEYKSLATTLASKWLTLLSVEPSNTKLEYDAHIDEANASQRWPNVKVSLILSTMWAQVCKAKDNKKELQSLPEKWKALTTVDGKSSITELPTVREINAMRYLPYQETLAPIINTLRAALVKVITDVNVNEELGNLGKFALDYSHGVHLHALVPQSSVGNLSSGLLFSNRFQQSSTTEAAAQQHSDEQRWMLDGLNGTITAPVPSTVTPKKQADLAAAIKDLDALLKDIRSKWKLPPGNSDWTPSFKLTYLRMMMDTDPTARKEAVLYITVCENLLNNESPKQIEDSQGQWVDILGKFRTLYDLGKISDYPSIKDAMGEKDALPTSYSAAVEWTRLWVTGDQELKTKLMEWCAPKDKPDVASVQTAVAVSIVSMYCHKADRWVAYDKYKEYIQTTPIKPFYFLASSKDAKAVAAASGDKSSSDGLVAPHGPPVLKRIEKAKLKHFLCNYLPMDDGYFWYWCIENGMVCGIGFVLHRPHCRYMMGTMVLMAAWGKTGYTFHGRADMMLSDDAAHKLHYGHYTQEMKSVILQSGNIIHARDVVCQINKGGADHTMWNAGDQLDQEDYKANVLNKSIFVVPVPMNYKIDVNVLDITGSWGTSLNVQQQCQQRTFLPYSQIYAHFWGWDNNTGTHAQCMKDASFSRTLPSKLNTIVFQEHQWMYNHVSKQWDVCITNKGHWGDRVYPGCVNDRMGKGDRYLKPVSYAKTSTMALIT